MANQVAARLSGDDFQHMFSWLEVTKLLIPRFNVVSVRVEDPDALSVDDVTVRHDPESGLPQRFFQVKYHVDQRGAYSSESLMESTSTGSSLLTKLYRSYQKLKQADPEVKRELWLVSNWSWKGDDKIGACVSGRDCSLSDAFFGASDQREIGKIRRSWANHLGAADDEFLRFAKSLRFRLGFQCWEELIDRIKERMMSHGLRHDEGALLIASGIVREWIKAGQHDLTRGALEETLKRYDLYLPPESEPSVHVYLTTIKTQKFDIDPDYCLDWRDRFLGSPNKRGHDLKDPREWNDRLLPEILDLEHRINNETPCRLIRARGLSRLSAWFAFGHTFSEVNRYTIEVDQRGALWRTDAAPSNDFRLEASTGDQGDRLGEAVDPDGATVALGISVSGCLESDLRIYLEEDRSERIAALLLLKANRELGHDCLRGAGDAVALAVSAKALACKFVRDWRATRLLIFYYGPLAGACFIGHRLNAVCREIQIMESLQPGYTHSFLLS